MQLSVHRVHVILPFDCDTAALEKRRVKVHPRGTAAQIRPCAEVLADPHQALAPLSGNPELRRALETFPVRARERITVEYVLLAGVTDSPNDARRLADFCASFPHNINLIPFNEHPLAPYRAPSEARVDAFAKALLAQTRTLITVRRSRGRDVQAACGQLVQR